MNLNELDTKPRALEVSGPDTVAIINEIKARGGQVCGMAQASGANGRWKLSIHWPKEAASISLAAMCDTKSQGAVAVGCSDLLGGVKLVTSQPAQLM
jgi:hypothetical protein